MLISSHILTEMDEFCTSVAIMERGKLKVGGRIDEVNQRIMGHLLISVEVLGEAERLLSIVQASGKAGEVERKNHQTYEFRFDGDQEAACELLSALVHGGVRVASFERRRDNLEELFLKVGSKELS